MKKQNRRSFLQFLGRAGLTVSGGSLLMSLEACSNGNAVNNQTTAVPSLSSFPLKSITPSLADDLQLADGLNYEVLIS